MLGLPEELPEQVHTPAEARCWIAEDYRAQGYLVTPEPTESDLPREFWDFHMDFLAERGNEHVAIVVRRRNDISENTKALAAALESRTDWILDLVVLPTSSLATLPEKAQQQRAA